MPMPWSYRHSEREFKSFLRDAKDKMGHIHESDNSTYTAIEGVLCCFRARLTPEQVVAFGNILPSTLRAILVYDWDVCALPRAFAARPDLVQEVKNHRLHHNLTPDNAIEATAFALWRHCVHRDLKRVLADIGPDAIEFWTVEDVPSKELERRII